MSWTQIAELAVLCGALVVLLVVLALNVGRGNGGGLAWLDLERPAEAFDGRRLGPALGGKCGAGVVGQPPLREQSGDRLAVDHLGESDRCRARGRAEGESLTAGKLG
jgi:hypothetical protein